MAAVAGDEEAAGAGAAPEAAVPAPALAPDAPDEEPPDDAPEDAPEDAPPEDEPLEDAPPEDAPPEDEPPDEPPHFGPVGGARSLATPKLSTDDPGSGYLTSLLSGDTQSVVGILATNMAGKFGVASRLERSGMAYSVWLR